VGDVLEREGDGQLARLVRSFVDHMPPAKTDHELLASALAPLHAKYAIVLQTGRLPDERANAG
jgi:hypothetical protein